MTRSIGRVVGTMLAIGAFTCGAAVVAGGKDDMERRIEAIKLPESQRKWQRIPWVTDLAEGQRLARREHRPSSSGSRATTRWSGAEATRPGSVWAPCPTTL